MIAAIRKWWWRLTLRPGVLVQDRDGRVRRVRSRSRREALGRLRAWVQRSGAVEHLPM